MKGERPPRQSAERKPLPNSPQTASRAWSPGPRSQPRLTRRCAARAWLSVSRGGCRGAAFVFVELNFCFFRLTKKVNSHFEEPKSKPALLAQQQSKCSTPLPPVLGRDSGCHRRPPLADDATADAGALGARGLVLGPRRRRRCCKGIAGKKSSRPPIVGVDVGAWQVRSFGGVFRVSFR